ncbi:MAG TPA: GntG family PLP-dependent aldolase [Myxococcaceae bacterium]|nr:GntG family PLP-dependent aldolase [Myxococcaceae bacterium]
MRIIDLRSDTVTRPGPGMRQAMASAELGDDVFGEDPTVRRLEERIAQLLGKEAALFVPSGTMANQLAIGLQCRPGDEVIAEAGSHCVNFESGALSALWGVQPRTIQGERGMLAPEQVVMAIRAVTDWYPRSRLLALENTHNRGGGTVWPLERLRRCAEAARARGLSVHLDGARLFNAQVASGVLVSEFAAVADTVSVCFSKGLGAPVGSALAGTTELVREARRLRKRLGGGMRQAGVLAAAALYALDYNVDRLAEDHRSARALADGLSRIPGVEVDLEQVETNMVFVDFSEPAAQACERLRQVGVLANPEGSLPRRARMVTHLDAPPAHIEEALGRMRVCLDRSLIPTASASAPWPVGTQSSSSP